MSQVKKLQTGGTPGWMPNEIVGVKPLELKPVPEFKPNQTTSEDLHKVGSLTIGGKKYEATPEFIQYLSGRLEGAETLAGLTSALQNGENLVYDPVANTITGMSGKWTGISNKMENRRNFGTSNWRKKWEATFDLDAHRFRNDLKRLAGIAYTGSEGQNGNNASTDLTDIYGNESWFDYIKGDDGKLSWDKNSSLNASLMKRVDDMSAYLNGTDEDKKKYRLGSEYSSQHMSGLQALYDQNKDRWANDLQQVKDRIQNGTYTDEDLAFLKNFFIIKPEEPVDEAAIALDKEKRRFKDSGFDYNTWSPYLSWDENGNYWTISPEGQAAFRNAFGGNGNYWFNDAFKSSQYNQNGAYDFLNGYFVLGNRLYNQNEAKDPTSGLSKILNRRGGFRDLNAGMRHGEANNLIEQLWGSEVGWNAPNGEYYSNWMDPNGNIYYRSRTGDYDWAGKNGNQQLVQYVEANPELADEFGYYVPKFRVTDAYGNVDLNQQVPESVNGLTEKPLSSRQASEFNRRKLWFSDEGNSEFDGRYLLGDGADQNGKVTGAGFWIDPNNPDAEWIFESDEMSRYVNGLDGNAVKIPKEMSNILQQNKNFMWNFQNNPEFRRKFVKVIAGAVGSGWNLSTAGANVTPAMWRAIGFTQEQSNALAKIGKNYSQNWAVFKSSRGARRAERVVSKPTLHKDGGKIEKDQMGNMIGSAGSVNAAPTQVKVEQPLRDPGSFANFGKDKLQDHDWLELGAVLGDAASIGLAFTPASVASGVTGMAGSTAGFIADVKRDGFQSSDLGQYGLNLLLDSVSFLPVVGGGAKAVKIANSLRKLAPTVNKIMKAAAIYGISNAGVQSWEAVKNGNFNMRDLRVLVNALGGAAHMARAGVKKPTLNKGEVTYPTIKPKAGKQANALQLSESQFEAIKSKGVKTKDEFASEIANVMNKSRANGAPEITKEQIMDTYDLDEFVRTNRRFLLFGKEQSKLKGFESKKGKKTLGSEYITSNQHANRLHEAYRKNIAGETKISEVVPGKTTTELVPQGQWKPKQGVVMEVDANGVAIPKKAVVNEADKALPVVLQKVTKTTPSFEISHNLPRITPVTSGVIWERTPDEITSPAEVIPIRTVNKGYTWRGNNQPVFRKKGGKIVKDQDGASLTDKAITGGMSDKLKKQRDEIMKALEDFDKDPENPGQGGFNGTPFNFDFTVPGNLLRMGYSMHQSDKQLNNWLNRPRYHMDAPLVNAPRFVDTGTGDAYDAAANKTRMFKNISPDLIAGDAMQRQRSTDATQLELQGNLARSKEFGQYKAGLDEFINKDILRRTDINNQNKQFDWKHDIEDVQMTNSNIAEKSKFFDQFGYSALDWLNRQHTLKNEINATEDYDVAVRNAQDIYFAKLDELNKQGLDKNSDAYITQLRTIKSQYETAMRNAQIKSQKSHLAYPFSEFAKRGGKIGKEGKQSAVTYSRDPYPELLLQNAKDSTKIVEKLNDSVIKLILQTKPIHVS